jgi:predicted transcriptional regulator
MSLEFILGSKNRIKVLRILLKNDGVSGRLAGRMANLSPSAANATLHELVKTGLLIKSGTAGKHIYKINRQHYILVSLERIFAAEERTCHNIAQAIKRHIHKSNTTINLLGLGINQNDELSIVTRPELRQSSQIAIKLGKTLKTKFNLNLKTISSNSSILNGSHQLWLPSSGRTQSTAPQISRTRALKFFNLSQRPPRVKETSQWR